MEGSHAEDRHNPLPISRHQLQQPDCAKCVIAQKATSIWADDRRIACGAADMARYTSVISCLAIASWLRWRKDISRASRAARTSAQLG
jgi:hypothetical protein